MTNHPALHKELFGKEEVARNEDSRQPTLVQVIKAKKAKTRMSLIIPDQERSIRL